MSDRFNQTLNFAADPPEGGGGTKVAGSSFTADPPEGGGGTKAAFGTPTEVDSSTEEQAIDPPENTGGTGTTSA